jgi:predicted transcriptional regulator
MTRMPDPTPGTRPDPDSLHLHDTVRLSAEGIAKVLGDLEARVMRVVWALRDPATARAVHERVLREHEVAHLTVVTVLNKLVDKGLLSRDKADGVFHYRACWTEEDFRAHVSRRVVEGMLAFEPRALATSFVEVLAERDRAELAELRRLIDRRLEEEEP